MQNIFLTNTDEKNGSENNSRFPLNALGKARQQKLAQYAKRITGNKSKFLDYNLDELF